MCSDPRGPWCLFVRYFDDPLLNECDIHPVIIYMHSFVYLHVARGVVSHVSFHLYLQSQVYIGLSKLCLSLKIYNDVYLQVQPMFCSSNVVSWCMLRTKSSETDVMLTTSFFLVVFCIVHVSCWTINHYLLWIVSLCVFHICYSGRCI